MLRVLSIMGSPRKGGNTSTVLKEFEKLIEGKVILEHINVVDMALNGCIGCDYCQKYYESPSCIQKDDMPIIIEKIIKSDIIIYAAPVYVWDFPAQMKEVMDRHYCLVKCKAKEEISLIQGKKVILLTTCGGDAENNADLLIKIFEREMNYLQCEVLVKFVVPNCTLPRNLGKEKEEVAFKMLRSIDELIISN
ncbi:MAG: flavodoxin family protein [Calditrichaceae bacterium]|nr:flavodoxin family protein [Calditrichaceae bacterium]